MQNQNVRRWMHTFVHEVNQKLSRRLMEEYLAGGLIRTNPEEYAETFTQTTVGKYALKKIKKMTHDAMYDLIPQAGEDMVSDDIMYAILESDTWQMTGNVYHDYITTKGVKIRAIPENLFEFPDREVEIRDFIYIQLHEYVTEQVRRFTAGAGME